MLTFSLIEGYNTMDLIAACFFTSSITSLILLKAPDIKPKNKLRLIIKSSIVGISILSFVYIGLISLAACHSNAITNLPKEQILPYLSYLLMGPRFGIISSIIILLACITTSCMLIMVYSDYLKETFKIFQKKKSSSIIFTILISYIFSLIGFNGITKVTSPLLQILYPILILMVAKIILKQLFIFLKQIFNTKQKKEIYTENL